MGASVRAHSHRCDTSTSLYSQNRRIGIQLAPILFVLQGEDDLVAHKITKEQYTRNDQSTVDSARSSSSCLGELGHPSVQATNSSPNVTLPPSPAAVPNDQSPFNPAEEQGAEFDSDIVPFHNETERLATLKSLGMIDRHPEPRFDSITKIMKTVFQTPLSAVTLIGDDVIHFHSRAGEWASQAPRKGSFCDCVLERRCPRMLIVEDALEDARFANNRYVTGPPNIRFYCGAPLVGSTGHRYGTLCLVDFVPRRFTAEQYLLLSHFAELVTRELERDYVVQHGNTKLRAALHSANATTGHVLRAMDALDEAIMMTDISQPDWPVLYSNSAWGKATGTTPHSNNPDNSSPEDPSKPTPLFWEVFNMKALDIGDVATAMAAARTGQAFTLTVRSPVHEGHAITLRFKPSSEPGRLGAAPMPQVALPSGIGLDWMTAPQPDGEGEAAPLPPPQLGRVQTIAPNLGDAKRAALAAALSAVSGSAINPALTGTDSIADASSAAAAVADTMQDQLQQEQEGPVYYLCVILRQGPLPPPPRQFPVSPFAMVASADEANNALGRFMNNNNFSESNGHRSTSTSSSRPLSPAPSCSSPEQIAAELACAVPVWDSVDSQDLPVHKRLGRSSLRRAVSIGMLQTDQSSGAWGLTDRPPASLGGLCLGAMIGSGRGGRCYRGSWRTYPVAVKIVDLWEESVDGGASPSTSTSSAPPSPAVPDYMEPFGRALAGLPSHPNLVPVHHSSIVTAPSGLPDRVHLQIWLVEEYCNRGGLGDAIDTGLLRRKGGGKGADPLTVLLTARDIATGVHYLHLSGIVHGNLTGNNVLLNGDRADTHRGWRALVDGYALAASRANSHPTGDHIGTAPSNASDSGSSSAIVITSRDGSQHSGRIAENAANNGWYGAQPQHRIGHRKFKSLHGPSSPAHLPPEVLLGAAVCESTDAYSMGVLIWELWSGRRAWRTLGPLAVVRAVAVQGCQLPVPRDAPPALADLMQRCLSEDADARPSFAEIVNDLSEQILNY